MILKHIVILVACVLSIAHGATHIVNDCEEPGDNPVVIYDQEISKPGHILHTQTETVRIPAKGVADGEISCLTVTNLDSDANGGYPKIIEGGVGYNYVIIELKSQFNKGFDFRVTAYYSG
jgi:hypothetical protein